MKKAFVFCTTITILVTIVYASCPQIDPITCLEDGLAYDLGACCPKCIEIEEIIENIICIPELCMVPTCQDQPLSDCKLGQVFVPKGACRCCDTCVDKPVRKCDSINCDRVQCNSVNYEQCLAEGKAYAPQDGNCNCCASCENVRDVIKPRTCLKGLCNLINCKNQTPDNCLTSQVLVPADGKCFCCDTCVFRKEVDDCSYDN